MRRKGAAERGEWAAESDQTLGTGGGSSRAGVSDSKLHSLWLESQKGLSFDWPQRHSDTLVRPAKPKGWPVESTISKSPSTPSDPFLRTVMRVPAMSAFLRIRCYSALDCRPYRPAPNAASPRRREGEIRSPRILEEKERCPNSFTASRIFAASIRQIARS